MVLKGRFDSYQGHYGLCSVCRNPPNNQAHYLGEEQVRKFNVSIPVPTKDDIAAMATKAKDKAQDANRATKAKIVQLIEEHGDDQTKAELEALLIRTQAKLEAADRECMIIRRTITMEDIQQREATNLLRRSLANTQTKEV